MPLLPIRLFGDPVLRARAAEVTDFDERLRRLADDMLATMRAAAGAGLAANQVGVLKRLFTWEITAHRAERDGAPGESGASGAAGRFGSVVNPEIVDLSEEIQEGEEGCLSFPGLFYPTERPLRVRITGRDVHGDELTMDGEGLLARIILHEIDHLNGVLFVDHLARHDRKDAMRRIRAGELERNAAERDDPTADSRPDSPPASRPASRPDAAAG